MTPGDLFGAARDARMAERAPLAARLRPRSLDEVVGQGHLLGEGKPLRVLIEADRLSSVILWGPPGTGKTTIARLIAGETSKAFEPLSAVAAGVKDVREVVGPPARASDQHSPIFTVALITPLLITILMHPFFFSFPMATRYTTRHDPLRKECILNTVSLRPSGIDGPWKTQAPRCHEQFKAILIVIEELQIGFWKMDHTCGLRTFQLAIRYRVISKEDQNSRLENLCIFSESIHLDKLFWL